MATGRYKGYYTVTYPDNVVLDGRSYTLTIKRDATASYAEKFAVEVVIYGRRLAYSDNVAYPANAAQATYTFSIPPDAAQYMTSATQALTFTVSRMTGSTPDGWEDYRGATATVPQSSAPTFSLSHNEAGTGVPSGWGYTRNLSKLAAYITGAAGKYGASVSSFKLSFAGFSSTLSSMTTGVLSASGTFALTATVTDTRGMSTVKTVNVSVRDYQFPTIVSASASRCNASGVADEEGTSAKVQCDYTNSTAGGLNAVTTTLQYRVSGASAWTTVAGGFADNVAKVVAGTFGTDSQYEFLFTVADKAKTVSRSATLDMAFFTMDFLSGGKGIAFGAPATRAGFDCRMPAYFNQLQVAASYAQSACDSLMSTSWGAKRVIGANANLNTYTNPGSYTCNADVNAKTLSNCPTGGYSFHLVVDRVLGGSSYLTQTLRQYNLNVIWTRFSTNGGASWGSWERNFGSVGSQYANGYYGMTRPDGNASDWIRTTQSGLIPYQSGGNGSLGTSTWPFSSMYTNNMYVGGQRISDFVVASGWSGEWYYVKFANGFAVAACTHYHSFSGGCNAWGNVWETKTTHYVNYPFTFASVSFVSCTPLTGAGFWVEYQNDGNGSTSPQVYFCRGGANLSGGGNAKWLVIGTWK